LIRFLAFFGLTYNLHTFPENEVKKGIIQMARKNLDKMASQIDWGPEIERLPIYTTEQVAKSKQAGEKLIIIGGNISDYFLLHQIVLCS
jgi:stearoyl-CoA desaturase (delta-9 desaturase)